MTIVNPTPITQSVDSPREEGTGQADQLYRLSLLASEVMRRFAHASKDKSALTYVLNAEDFDAAEHADAAARLVAHVLAFIANEVANPRVLATSCRAESKGRKYERGYIDALDQVGTEMIEMMSNRL